MLRLDTAEMPYAKGKTTDVWLGRKLQEARAAAQWDQCVEIISLAESGTLASLPTPVGRALQTKLLCVLVATICRTTGTQEEIDTATCELKTIIAKIASKQDLLHTGPQSIVSDVSKLHAILSFTSEEEASDDRHLAFEQARDAIVKDKQSVFNRSLTLFDTGIHVLSLASSVATQFKKEKGFATMLVEIELGLNQRPRGNTSGSGSPVAYGNRDMVQYTQVEERMLPCLHVPDHAYWSKLHVDCSMVLSNSSERFKKEQEAMLLKVADARAKLLDALSSSMMWACAAQFEAVAGAMLVEKPKAPQARAHADTAAAGISSLNPACVGAAVLPKAMVSKLTSRHKLWLDLIQLMVASVEWLCSFSLNPQLAIIGCTSVEKLFNAVAPESEQELPQDKLHINDVGAISKDFFNKMGARIAAPAKLQLEESLESLGPFILALIANKPDQAFTAELLGDDDTDGITSTLRKLEDSAKSFRAKYMMLLPSAARTVHLPDASKAAPEPKRKRVTDKAKGRQNDPQEVQEADPPIAGLSVDFILVAIILFGLGKKIAMCEKKLLEKDTTAKFHLGPLGGFWQPAMADLKRLEPIADTADSASGSTCDEFGTQPPCAANAWGHCAKQLIGVGVSAMKNVQDELNRHLTAVAELCRDGSLDNAVSLPEAAEVVKAGNLDSVKDELLGICDLENAGNLFAAFEKLHKSIGMQPKIKKVMDAALVDWHGKFAKEMQCFIEKSAIEYNRVLDQAKGGQLQKVGLILGNLTASQALLRNLAPGENRQQLVATVRSGIPRMRYLSLSPLMRKLIGIPSGPSGAPSGGDLQADTVVVE